MFRGRNRAILKITEVRMAIMPNEQMEPDQNSSKSSSFLFSCKSPCSINCS